MQVHKKVVIDIASGKVVESRPYEHYGGFEECKGGSSGQTSTTTNSLPAFLQPWAERYIKSYAGQAFNTDPTTGDYTPIGMPTNLTLQTAGFQPEQTAAMSAMSSMTPGAQGLANVGGMNAANTLAGSYLSPESNPWLYGTFDAAARKVTDAYSTATAPGITAQFQRAGQFGSSAMNEALGLSRSTLGDNLDALAAQIYGGNYQLERDRQLQTMGTLPNTINTLYAPQQALYGVGAQQQEQEQQELDTDYNNAATQAEWPFNIFSGFGGALGQAAGGGGSSTTRTSGAPSAGGLTVICTVLHDFGMMDDDLYEADCKFGEMVSEQVMAGYHRFGIPIAKVMRKSFVLTALVEPFVLSWAKTMKAKVEGRPENETLLGRIMLRLGVPFCRWLGRKGTKWDANAPEKIAARQQILRAQQWLAEKIATGEVESRMDQCRWTHHFVEPDRKYGCAVYAREMFAPKGTVMFGKIHRHDHLVFLMKGKITVATDEGNISLAAPCTFISKAGVKRVGYVEEDTIWTTCHLTRYFGEENLDKIEEEVIAPTFEDVGLLSGVPQ